jgi:hypothetical protein
MSCDGEGGRSGNVDPGPHVTLPVWALEAALAPYYATFSSLPPRNYVHELNGLLGTFRASVKIKVHRDWGKLNVYPGTSMRHLCNSTRIGKLKQ